MKIQKISTSFIVVAFAIATVFTACDSAQKNVDDAQKNLNQAQDDLVKAKQDSVQARQDSLVAIQNFKIDSEKKIAANETRIAELKAATAKQNKALKEKNDAKIVLLEQKNSDMRKEVNAYNQTTNEDWQEFKTKFNREMDELGKSLNDLLK